MSSNIDSFKQDIDRLIKAGDEVFSLFLSESSLAKKSKKEDTRSFNLEYQSWYSEAMLVVKQLLPNRLPEFIDLYEGDKKRKAVDNTTFTIADWCRGLRAAPDFRGNKVNDSAAVAMRIHTQLNIVRSSAKRFESSLFDIRQLAQAELFDSELDTCDELVKKGFLRASGVVAGVVLERHLAQVCASHDVIVKKKDPTIGDLIDLLKAAEVLDIPEWRSIQRLADLRNLCGHNKDREPSKDEVQELIAGVRKTSKTLF